MAASAPKSKTTKALTNSDIAELLAIEAKAATRDTAAKALRRASVAALFWPHEAAGLARENKLQELATVGPFVAKLIQGWCEDPPQPIERSELRRSFMTLTEARKLLLKNPLWTTLYQGDLQMHSTWSDGSASIREMAETAIARGYKYIGITDHTKGLKIAGGIDEQQLAEQGQEIDELNKHFAGKFRVLKSTELNLNPRGEGDMDPKALAKLDLVVGSFHSALRVKEDQTKRYLAALRNPSVHILGHPRGRVYNYRPGLQADWSQVFDLAAELGKAVEIDSYPDRQDLDFELLKLAKKAGCKVAIDTDAHSPGQLAFVELGLGAALKAGIQSENIINFLPYEKLLKWRPEHEHGT